MFIKCVYQKATKHCNAMQCAAMQCRVMLIVIAHSCIIYHTVELITQYILFAISLKQLLGVLACMCWTKSPCLA